jgi:hypothetical protein
VFRRKRDKPTACSQCGKPAVVQYGDIWLCVDCNLRFQQAEQLRYSRAISEYNFHTYQMELAAMLPIGILGRVPHPQSPFQGNTLTLNNISIDRSTIGALNTGNIKRLDVAITRMQDSGRADLGDVLKELTEAILENQDIDDLRKNELLEHLSFLAEQSGLPKEQRSPNIAKVVFDAVAVLASNSQNLKRLWEQSDQVFREALGIGE